MKSKLIFMMAVALFVTGCVTHTPVMATKEKFGGKVGESCSTGILGFKPFMGQSNTIEEAKKNGKIKTISSVDSVEKNYILFTKFCTVVSGS